jgi:hypothetical protein
VLSPAPAQHGATIPPAGAKRTHTDNGPRTMHTTPTS